MRVVITGEITLPKINTVGKEVINLKLLQRDIIEWSQYINNFFASTCMKDTRGSDLPKI